MPIRMPIVRPTNSIGAASISVISSARWPIVITVSGVMRSPLAIETRGQRPHDQRPTVDQHERHEKQEAYLKRGLELTGHECRHQQRQRHILRTGKALAAGNAYECGDVALARLLEHEGLE